MLEPKYFDTSLHNVRIACTFHISDPLYYLFCSTLVLSLFGGRLLCLITAGLQILAKFSVS